MYFAPHTKKTTTQTQGIRKLLAMFRLGLQDREQRANEEGKDSSMEAPARALGWVASESIFTVLEEAHGGGEGMEVG